MHDVGPPLLTADEALRRLVAGNERFQRGEASAMSPGKESLAELALGQRPYATILGCSDSRVPPEWLFDAAPGELFVIRVAGNVFSSAVAGSLQYAGSHLKTPLFVVLGHQRCGAVEAAMQTQTDGTLHRSRIQVLVDSIVPGLPAPDPALPPSLRLARAIEANVRWTVHQIMQTPEAQERKGQGHTKIVGALYDIESGAVRFLPEE